MSKVVPGSPRWRELVMQGIVKAGDRNWFLGDAALEISPESEPRDDLLRQYAEEISVEPVKLRLYRKVSLAWPVKQRWHGTAWRVHQALMNRPELMRPGMTLTQAAAALGQRNVGRTGPEAGVEDKVAAVRDYLADPAVAEKVFADADVVGDAVRAAYVPIAQAMEDRDKRVREQVAPPGSEEAKTRESEQQAYEVLEVMQRMHQMITATSRLAGLGSLTKNQVELIVPLAQRAKAAVEFLASLEPVDGALSMDDELASLLRDDS